MDFVAFFSTHPLLAPLLVVLLRFVGVVVAPVPGAPVAFASMVFFPWWEAFLLNVTGAWLGAVVAFYIARWFREPVVKYLAPLKRLHQWQNELTDSQQFLAFVGLRIISIPAFDFVSYAAGLSAIPFRIFVLATLLVDLPVNIVFFYLGGLAAEASWYLFAAYMGSILLLLALAAKYWKRNTN
jgi:uncharacterized membrane protein YdjX (TVP38/TMEM64 family)